MMSMPKHRDRVGHPECHMGLRPCPPIDGKVLPGPVIPILHAGEESASHVLLRSRFPETPSGRGPRRYACTRQCGATLFGMTEWPDDFQRSGARCRSPLEEPAAPSRRGLGIIGQGISSALEN